jgi:hypothetical protein
MGYTMYSQIEVKCDSCEETETWLADGPRDGQRQARTEGWSFTRGGPAGGAKPAKAHCPNCNGNRFSDWKDSKEMGWPSEVFRCWLQRWDIDKAKEKLREKPRAPQTIKVGDVEKLLSKITDLGNGKHRVTMGVTVDWEAAKSGKTKLGDVIDLSVPLIGILDDSGEGTIIDGHHRIARAVELKVKELPVVVLDAEEAKEIEL